jgi:aspartyl-tRNA(Asn)/glutamyl-tRNA(Gln) amidotransferase subunit C
MSEKNEAKIETFTADDVRKIAHLARLELTDEEANTFSKQLGDVLGYVSQLSEYNTDGVDILIHPTRDPNLATPLREDNPRDSLGSEKVLNSAPESKHSQFKVPTVF